MTDDRDHIPESSSRLAWSPDACRRLVAALQLVLHPPLAVRGEIRRAEPDRCRSARRIRAAGLAAPPAYGAAPASGRTTCHTLTLASSLAVAIRLPSGL